MLDKRWGLVTALGALAALHLLIMALPPLNGDEAFYWEWSRHLALAYYSHPPLTAWAIALVTKVLGATQFTVRFTSLLWHAATLWIVWRMALDLSGERRFASRTVVLAACLPVLFLLGTIITTDAALICLWTATTYLTKRAVIDGERRAWYGVGLTAGGMLLTKFFAALYVPATLLFLLAHRRYRRELFRPELYGGLVIAILCFSPFLYWNATNHWLTFQFNFVARHQNEGFELFKVAYYLVGQVIAASPVFGMLLLPALWQYVPGAFAAGPASDTERKRRDALRYYAYIVAVPLLIFLFQSPFLHVGAHWAGVVFPTSAVLLVAWLHERAGTWNPAQLLRPKLWGLGLIGSAVVILPIAALLLVPTLLVPKAQRYIDPANGKQQLISHYFGWPEVGQRIAALRAEWSKRPEGFFFSTRDYSIASMFDFYTPGHADFVLVDYKDKEFHGKEFLLWAKGRKPKGASTIYVSDTQNAPNKPHPIAKYFERIEPMEPLVLRDKQGVLRIFYFTAGYGYLDNERDELQ
ncbi:MAG TPA: glycosyltransferase family 39 protein [bacterium]